SWPNETRPLRSGLDQASSSPSMRSSVATRKSHHYAFHVTAQSQSTVNAAGGASFTPTSVPVMSAIAAMANTPKVTGMNHGAGSSLDLDVATADCLVPGVISVAEHDPVPVVLADLVEILGLDQEVERPGAVDRGAAVDAGLETVRTTDD